MEINCLKIKTINECYTVGDQINNRSDNDALIKEIKYFPEYKLIKLIVKSKNAYIKYIQIPFNIRVELIEL